MRIAHIGAQLGQRHAQVIHERLERRFGTVGILADQAVHGRQRVEQEVRFDLRLQHHQPQIRLGPLPVQEGKLAGMPSELPPTLLAMEGEQRDAATQQTEDQELERPDCEEEQR